MPSSQKSALERRQAGIIQLIPLLVVATLAITTLVVVRNAQTNQEIQSRAAGSSKTCGSSSVTAFACRGVKVGSGCTGFDGICEETGNKSDSDVTCGCVATGATTCEPNTCGRAGTNLWRLCSSDGSRYTGSYSTEADCEKDAQGGKGGGTGGGGGDGDDASGQRCNTRDPKSCPSGFTCEEFGGAPEEGTCQKSTGGDGDDETGTSTCGPNKKGTCTGGKVCKNMGYGYWSCVAPTPTPKTAGSGSGDCNGPLGSCTCSSDGKSLIRAGKSYPCPAGTECKSAYFGASAKCVLKQKPLCPQGQTCKSSCSPSYDTGTSCTYGSYPVKEGTCCRNY